MAEDTELWGAICDGPFVPTKNLGDAAVAIPKTRKEFNDADIKAIEKNFRAKKILVCGIGPDEYNRISACQSAQEIWEALQIPHKGTTQVKQSKIDMLTTKYEHFRMKDDESVQDIHTRFTSIINELHSLGETIPRNKMVRKILNVLPSSWESKVNAITEATELQELTIDELVAKRNLVPDKRFNRKDVVDNVVRQALAAWGNASSESGEDDEVELGEVEQSKDDIVVVAVDLREIIENLKKERYDLMTVVVDLKETILELVVMDLKETIGELKMESRPENSQKGKEVASETHIKLK
ncbi:PREDICTED: uncharacterized protein LOC109241124, partial [Nicotiana attenuata]|uniref:uncharacterized protein LOC109241124 n=1 Tax=Nicotiana attenuata TaxID=49451 RepID=UPI0009056D6C